MYVHVDIDIDDVIDDLSEKEAGKVLERLQKRQAPQGSDTRTDEGVLIEIFNHFRRAGDAPECVREYLWRTLGRVL